MQLHPDFNRQSENQQMTQDFYKNSELQESVFLSKTPGTFISNPLLTNSCFLTLLITFPLFWRLTTLATLHSQAHCCHTASEESPVHSWCSHTAWCSLHISAFTWHASGVFCSRNPHKSCSKIISGLLNIARFYFHLNFSQFLVRVSAFCKKLLDIKKCYCSMFIKS